MKVYTDKHRDNIPALLLSMWYCGSLCAALLWRYITPKLTNQKAMFITCSKYTNPRMSLLAWFWVAEAGFGLLALRSLNFANDEARDKVTPLYAVAKLRLLSLARESAANGFLRVVCTPWEKDAKFSHHFGLSVILTALLGKWYSALCIVEALWTIRSMVNNTRAYQGQQGVEKVYTATVISALVYTLGYLLSDGQLCIGFSFLSWCCFKLLIALFQRLDEYYWLKHFHRDHELQRSYLKKLGKN